MQKRRTMWGVALAALSMTILALVAVAAPFVPAVPPVSDEIRTLAKVDKVVLVVDLPPEMIDAGLTEALLREQWTPRLAEVGIEIVNDPDATPFRLHLMAFMSIDDDSVPNGRGFCMFLMLEQPVLVERLESRLQIPTWTGLMAGITNKEGLGEAARKAANDQIDNYLYKTKLANDAQ